MAAFFWCFAYIFCVKLKALLLSFCCKHYLLIGMDRPFIVVAGASGVVGRHFIREALTRYDVKVLTRKVDGDELGEAFEWKPQAAKENDDAALNELADILSNARAVVNLAGSSIGDGRLNEAHKKKVMDSRVNSTNTLVEAFKRAEIKPNMWFQASGVGYYGDRGEEELTESSKPQEDFFLAKTLIAWEDAAKSLSDETRIVIGRMGVVLAKDAPSWQRMILPIKLFVGGPLGSGKQWYTWISADDLAKAMSYLIADSSSRGVYNLVAPHPVRQIDLFKAAAKKLGRPAFMPAPSFALKLIVGEVADAVLLPSAKVLRSRLQEARFAFDHPDVDAVMEYLF